MNKTMEKEIIKTPFGIFKVNLETHKTTFGNIENLKIKEIEVVR